MTATAAVCLPTYRPESHDPSSTLVLHDFDDPGWSHVAVVDAGGVVNIVVHYVDHMVFGTITLYCRAWSIGAS